MFVDEIALELKLTLKAQVAFMILSRHANRNGFTTVGKKRIARLSGMGISSAKRALQELEGGSLVTPYGKQEGVNENRRGRLLTPLRESQRPLKELGTIQRKGFVNNKEEEKKKYAEKYGEGIEPLP